MVAGFQGINASSDVTTLGRGWSDLTAVALAARSKPTSLHHLYGCRRGIYCRSQYRPGRASTRQDFVQEMLEMADLGAKGAGRAARSNCSQIFRSGGSQFKLQGRGTLVTREDADMEGSWCPGVTGDRNQAKLIIVGVPDRPDCRACLGAVANANIVVDMIIQNVGQASMTDISFYGSQTGFAQTPWISFSGCRRRSGSVGCHH